MIHKLVIIGSGPAGLTAGIYAGRAGLEPLIIEGPLPGGQLMLTTKVENWPSYESVDGIHLMKSMRSQAEKCGSKFMSGSVKSVDFSGRPLKIMVGNQMIEALSIIIATGSSNKRLGVPGEDQYFGRGISVCATCDAPFFRNKNVVVIGGGNTAMTEAEHLLNFVKSLTIIQNTATMTANDPIKYKVIGHEKVTCIFNSTVTGFEGDGQSVNSLTIKNLLTGQEDKKMIEGAFVSIGMNPNSTPFKGHIELDNWGYIVAKPRYATNVPGVFYAGDVSDFRYRQAVTAAGEGCAAALEVQWYLATL